MKRGRGMWRWRRGGVKGHEGRGGDGGEEW